MNQDGGGWLWLVIDVGFVGILGLALAYGTMQWRQMSARQKQRRDDATPTSIDNGGRADWFPASVQQARQIKLLELPRRENLQSPYDRFNCPRDAGDPTVILWLAEPVAD